MYQSTSQASLTHYQSKEGCSFGIDPTIEQVQIKGGVTASKLV